MLGCVLGDQEALSWGGAGHGEPQGRGHRSLGSRGLLSLPAAMLVSSERCGRWSLVSRGSCLCDQRGSKAHQWMGVSGKHGGGNAANSLEGGENG